MFVPSLWIAALLTAAPNVATVATYVGHQVVRVYPKSETERRHAIAVSDDVWSERIAGTHVDVRLDPQGLAALRASGTDFDVLIADVQLRVDEENERLTTAPAPTYGTWFNDFRNFSEVDGFLDTLAATAPNVTEVFEVGQSLEGRTVRGIRIGRSTPDKSGLLLTGTMHAREWLSPMTVSCVADRLIGAYGTDTEITELLDVTDVYMVPVLNPDGFVLSWGGNRYWRKNTRDGVGVDLNRNWGYEWGGEGASPNPGDENYRGPSAFSEPETQILRDFIQSQPSLVAHIDFHSYAELIIYPWGYGYEAAPDEALLDTLASTMSTAIAGEHGHNYQPIQGADFYPAAGAVDDWAYGSAGLMAFTIELRGDDFVVSPGEILPACDENYAAVIELLQWSADQSSADPGPGGGTTGAETGDPSDSDTAAESGTGGDEGATGVDSAGGAEAGTASAGESDAVPDASGAGGEDESNDDAAGTSGGWLPGAYGNGTGGGGCSVDAPHLPPATLLFFIAFLIRMRRPR